MISKVDKMIHFYQLLSSTPVSAIDYLSPYIQYHREYSKTTGKYFSDEVFGTFEDESPSKEMSKLRLFLNGVVLEHPVYCISLYTLYRYLYTICTNVIKKTVTYLGTWKFIKVFS